MLDQGSILYGVRSEKYPNQCCYGIIISASCDIANNKISKLYYLVAVEVKEWFLTEEGYRYTYEEKIKSLAKKLEQVAEKEHLDARVLMSFTDSELEKVFEGLEIKNKQKKELNEAIDNYCLFGKTEGVREKKENAICNNSSPIVRFLEKASKGEVIHYYYLPEDAYKSNGVKNNGLIIDLQEIEILSLDDAKTIESVGIDALLLPEIPSQEERNRLMQKYWLDKSENFVMFSGNIRSPWREHLMQRFSHAFVRIGLDGAMKKDYEELANDIKGVQNENV